MHHHFLCFRKHLMMPALERALQRSMSDVDQKGCILKCKSNRPGRAAQLVRASSPSTKGAGSIQSGNAEQSTNAGIKKWNNKSMFFSSLSPSLIFNFFKMKVDFWSRWKCRQTRWTSSYNHRKNYNKISKQHSEPSENQAVWKSDNQGF